MLYGSKLASAQVAARKQSFYDKHKDFQQSINNITISRSEIGYTVHFQKHTSFGGKTSAVDGYLAIRQQGDDWKIMEESDGMTDKNILLKKQKTGAGEIKGRLQGDFDGDGKIDTLTYKLIKEGAFDEGGYIFSLSFSISGIRSFTFNSEQDYIYLINEGDLDGKPGDEFSIFAPPNHGCSFEMQAYHLLNGEVKPLIESFLVMTYCDGFGDKDLQGRIFKEGNTIYYYSVDPNDEHNPPRKIKTKATLIK